VSHPVSQLFVLDYWLTEDRLLTTWIAPPDRGLSTRDEFGHDTELIHWSS